MYLSGKHFVYDNVYSSIYGLSILEMDTEALKSAEGEVEYYTSFFSALKTRYITGMSREDSPLEFEVEIVAEDGIQPSVARDIKKWLFNSHSFKKLYIDPADDEEVELVDGLIKKQYLECIFKNPQKIEFAQGTVGWKCTCLCSSSMAIQEEITAKYNDFSKDIILDVDTDIDDYVYPYLVISTNGVSDIKIVNKTDNNRTMVIKRPTSSITLYSDCALGTIINNSGVSYYEHLGNQIFLRLLPGKNTLNISGSIKSMDIIWHNARWMT